MLTAAVTLIPSPADSWIVSNRIALRGSFTALYIRISGSTLDKPLLPTLISMFAAYSNHMQKNVRYSESLKPSAGHFGYATRGQFAFITTRSNGELTGLDCVNLHCLFGNFLT